MRCAIYVRVSTDKQEAENQLIDLRRYADKSNFTIYREYIDIISGKEEKRPSFEALFQDAHKKLFDVLLFWDLSRFSRSGTLFTLQKLTELKNLGIDYISYQEPHITTLGAFGDVLISILSTLAKIEREKISERTKAGLRRAKENGKKLGRPKISEYRKKQIISMYESGNYLSTRAIWGELNKSKKISYNTVRNVVNGYEGSK